MNVTNKAYSDRIKLPISFDIDKLKAETLQLKLNHFIYYNVIPMRSPAHTVDPSLPIPPPADDYADGSWTEWMDTPALTASPYIKEVVDYFKQHTNVTLVRILRLAPGGVVKEHTDPTLGIEIEKSVVRLTIPILNGDGVEFLLNGTHVDMKPGECWYMRLTDPHKVINAGQQERINLTIDMIPNEWLVSMLDQGMN